MRTFLSLLFLSLSPWGFAVGLSPGLIGAYSVPKAISGGGGGSITRKGVVEGSDGSVASTWDLTGTLNVAAGDLVTVGTGGTVDATAVSVGGQACTEIKVVNASGYYVSLWYLANASANAAATVTITAAGANFAVGAAANYSGLSATPLDQSSCNTSGCNATTDSINITAQNVTTTSANELLVCWSPTDANHSSWTASGSFTLRTATGTKNWALLDRIVSSTGSYPGGTVLTVDSGGDNLYWSTFATFK